MKNLKFSKILIPTFVFVFGLTVFLGSFSASAAEEDPEIKQEVLHHGFPCEEHCDWTECIVGGTGSTCLVGVPCYGPSTHGACYPAK